MVNAEQVRSEGDAIVRAGSATVEVTTFDPAKRDFMRGFGQSMGGFTYGGEAYELTTWGHVMEIRRKNGGIRLVAEINIQAAMKAAVELLTNGL